MRSNWGGPWSEHAGGISFLAVSSQDLTARWRCLPFAARDRACSSGSCACARARCSTVPVSAAASYTAMPIKQIFFFCRRSHRFGSSVQNRYPALFVCGGFLSSASPRGTNILDNPLDRKRLNKVYVSQLHRLKLYHTPSVSKYKIFLDIIIWTIYGSKWMYQHTKMCLDTSESKNAKIFYI